MMWPLFWFLSLVYSLVFTLPSCSLWLGLPRRPGFDSCVGKFPWRREWYFCLENPHRQRSLVSYSLWGCRVGHNWAAKSSTQSMVTFFFFFSFLNVFYCKVISLQLIKINGKKKRSGYFPNVSLTFSISCFPL